MKKIFMVFLAVILVATFVIACSAGGGKTGESVQNPSQSGIGQGQANPTAFFIYREKVNGFPIQILENFFEAIKNGWAPITESYIYDKGVINDILNQILDRSLNGRGISSVEVTNASNDGCNWAFDYTIRFGDGVVYQEHGWIIKDVLDGQWKIAELMRRGHLGVLLTFYDAVKNQQYSEAEKYIAPEDLAYYFPTGGVAAYFGGYVVRCIEIRSITGAGIHYYTYYKNTTETGTECARVVLKNGVWVIQDL